jgi:hypothetical protein
VQLHRRLGKEKRASTLPARPEKKDVQKNHQGATAGPQLTWMVLVGRFFALEVMVRVPSMVSPAWSAAGQVD